MNEYFRSRDNLLDVWSNKDLLLLSEDRQAKDNNDTQNHKSTGYKRVETIPRTLQLSISDGN